MATTKRRTPSLTFYQPNASLRQRTLTTGFVGGITALPTAAMEFTTYQYTSNVNQAFTQLKTSVIQRGLQYANNTVASRGGYIAEDFVAGTYNLDAVIKRQNPSAIVPQSHDAASADIIYDNNKSASLKYNGDAVSTAKNQTRVAYGNQVRVVPADQVDDVKAALDDMSHKNLLKGRPDAAKIQQDTKKLVDDRIRGDNGVQSTPLTKEQDMKLAKAIKKGDNGPQVDKKQIDAVLKDTGVTQKTKKAIFNNELHGIAMAAAIGAGIGFTISFAVTLAETGITPDSVKTALSKGASGGLESGFLSTVGYGIGRTIGSTVSAAVTGTLRNLGLSITDNIVKMCNMAVVGTMTIAVFSAYQFVKLKLNGTNTYDALIQVGKQAVFSLSVLAVSLAAQCLLGGAAGAVVSVTAGVVCILYSLTTSMERKVFTEKIQVFLIDYCKPSWT